jgi:hypothetical protein
MAVDEVDELYPKPAPDPTYEKQHAPGSIAQGLSKALMQSAFSKFGQAFTDTGDVKKDAATRESRLAPYMEAGGQAASALQARWNTMEYDNFNNEILEPYTGQKKALLDDYQRRSAQADIGIFEGPDGLPMPLDVQNSAEDRLLAGKMSAQLTKRFYALNSDMDMALFNEAGKYNSNPMITGRATAIQEATAETLKTIANPEDSLDTRDKESIIRKREADSAAAMVQAKGTAARAKDEKRPVSYDDAMAAPNIGAGGIIRWFISDPNGIAIMQTGGGSTYLKSEKKLAKGSLMKNDPSLTEGSAELEDALERTSPQWLTAAATKYLKYLSPKDYELAKQITPHFFAQESEAPEVGIKSGDRIDPGVREANLKTWENHAEEHFKKYMQSGEKDPDIEAAMADLEEWMDAAIYGETEEPELLAVSATRSAGNRRYVEEMREGVLKHIKAWWHSRKGSGVAKEENEAEAGHQARLSGSRGPRAQRRARMFERRRNKKKKDDGGLNLP